MTVTSQFWQRWTGRSGQLAKFWFMRPAPAILKLDAVTSALLGIIDQIFYSSSDLRLVIYKTGKKVEKC